MNAWLQFLTRNGARIDDAPNPGVLGFGGQPTETAIPQNFISPLTDLGLIAASGDEAAHFLHNQLTNDVEHLGMNEARLAGYCSPKGRMLASFLMWKSGDTFMLQLPREIQPAVQKRLQMFILRAKVKLADATDNNAVLGLAGDAVGAAVAKWFPFLPNAPYAKVEADAGSLIRVADAFGVPRYQWIAPLAVAEEAWPELVKTLTPAGTHIWRLANIHAGIPQITLATQEQFVPQMVNFEVIGGVNFKKGCYPGQEIVARSQYLGKLKRRMLLASAEAADAKAGMEVFSSADPDQPCGMVVNAERNSQAGFDCIVEMKVAAIDEGTIHLGSMQGPQLVFGTLPYTLPG
ncbi:MAG TPA: folate-binding protein [Noviherbaspirillum sp.]|nr:folate-binding protein [Noviherbaspirillum sp.]